jgi:hypothetical protein
MIPAATIGTRLARFRGGVLGARRSTRSGVSVRDHRGREVPVLFMPEGEIRFDVRVGSGGAVSAGDFVTLFGTWAAATTATTATTTLLAVPLAVFAITGRAVAIGVFQVGIALITSPVLGVAGEGFVVIMGGRRSRLVDVVSGAPSRLGERGAFQQAIAEAVVILVGSAVDASLPGRRRFIVMEPAQRIGVGIVRGGRARRGLLLGVLQHRPMVFVRGAGFAVIALDQAGAEALLLIVVDERLANLGGQRRGVRAGFAIPFPGPAFRQLGIAGFDLAAEVLKMLRAEFINIGQVLVPGSDRGGFRAEFRLGDRHLILAATAASTGAALPLVLPLAIVRGVRVRVPGSGRRHLVPIATAEAACGFDGAFDGAAISLVPIKAGTVKMLGTSGPTKHAGGASRSLLVEARRIPTLLPSSRGAVIPIVTSAIVPAPIIPIEVSRSLPATAIPAGESAPVTGAAFAHVKVGVIRVAAARVPFLVPGGLFLADPSAAITAPAATFVPLGVATVSPVGAPIGSGAGTALLEPFVARLVVTERSGVSLGSAARRAVIAAGAIAPVVFTVVRAALSARRPAGGDPFAAGDQLVEPLAPFEVDGVNVGDVEEAVSADAEIDEGGLDAGFDVDDLAAVDVADDPLVGVSFDVKFLEHPILEDGDARLLRLEAVDQHFLLFHGRPFGKERAPDQEAEGSSRRRLRRTVIPSAAYPRSESRSRSSSWRTVAPLSTRQ